MQLQEIAKRCQQGDHEAFALLYTAMRQQLRAVCMRYVQNETVADDLVHDAFLLIFAKIGELKDTARIEAWMNMVARRVALLYLRQQKKSVPLAEAANIPVPIHNAPFTQSEILAAIDALPEGYRRVFRLSMLEGMSHQEIAALLHIEPHSSSSQLYHAKALLRRWLRPLLLLLLAITVPVEIMHWLQRQVHTPLSEVGPTKKATQVVRSEAPTADATAITPIVTPSPAPLTSQNIPIPLADSVTLPDENVPVTTEERRDTIPFHKVLASDDHYQQEPTDKAVNGHWSIHLAYNGMGRLNSANTMQLPYADNETNPMVSDSVSRHHLPLTVAVSVGYRLNRRWQLETGLSYTRMTSDFCSGNSYISLQQHQTVQYLGIPFSLSYHWPLSHHMQFFTSASTTLHLPLHSTLESYYLMPNGTKAEHSTQSLHPRLQWSIDLGVGLQYELTPQVSFFVQPSLQHYLNNGSSVSTWNTEHSFALSIPIGLMISF